MYEAFFDLKCKPFSLLPDPEFLFLSGRHSIGLSLLDYSITGQAGFCVITGEIGSGKTTLIRTFLGRIGREFTVGLISNTHASISDVAAWTLIAFGQKPSTASAPEVYQELMSYLIGEYGAGRQCVLVIDEAQNLTVEALEEIRLLSNINSGKDLLLQIVLVGQPELLDKLKRPELRQFAQRIAISHHLYPLSFSDTRSYIEHRLKVAGTSRPIFTEMALGAIQYFSGGVPRLINSICDLSMVYAFAEGKTDIDEELVFRVISDRQVSGIAPFHHATLTDDPAVRAEIMSLARSHQKVPGSTARRETPVPAPEVLSTADPEIPTPVPVASASVALAPGTLAPAPSTIVRTPVAPAAAATATRHTQVVRPIAADRDVIVPPLVEKPLNAGREPVLASAPVEKHPEEYYFGGPESEDDLLLTREFGAPLIDSFGEAGTQLVRTVPQDDDDSLPLANVNGAGLSRWDRDIERLPVRSAAKRNVHAGAIASNSSVSPYPSISRRSGRVDLRGTAEDSVEVGGNAGTTEPSPRSWWRRAFRRGN